MIFNELFYDLKQPHNSLLFVRQAGKLNGDADYVIERKNSSTNVIGCVHSGILYIEQDRKTYTLTAGHSFVLPHNSAYRLFSDSRNLAQTVWLNLRGQLINDAIDRLFSSKVAVSAYPTEPFLTSVITYSMSETDHLPEITGMVFRCLIGIYRGQKNQINEQPAKDSYERMFDEYICKNIHQPFSVNKMANDLNMSENTLSRKFKAVMGTSPFAYYQSIRLQFACSLLVNTDLTIDDIASRLNYSDRNYFTLSFAKCFHVSPGKYRKLHQGRKEENSADDENPLNE